MKKISLYLFLALLAALSACSNDKNLEDLTNPGENSPITFEAELMPAQSRMQFEGFDDNGANIKFTWDPTDVIRLYKVVGTTFTYVGTCNMEGAPNGSIAQFKVPGSVVLDNGTEYKAVAISADLIDSPTTYPGNADLSNVVTVQNGNTGINQLTQVVKLKSENSITYTTGALTFDKPFYFVEQGFALLKIDFTLKSATDIPTALNLTINPAAPSEVFTLKFENMTAGQPVTAYLPVPGSKNLSKISIDVFGTEGISQFTQTDGTLTSTVNGNLYTKSIDTDAWNDVAEFTLEALNKNLSLVGAANYATKSILGLANGEITITDTSVDAANTANRFTPAIRAALNSRTNGSLGLNFPELTGFPNGNSTVITNASAGAFLGVENISYIKAPKVTSIGNYTFYECSVQSVDFPVATTIGTYAFQKSGLTSVKFLEVNSIGQYAFYSCPALTSATFDVALNTGTNTFRASTALESVSFPLATTIDTYTFEGCTALTTVNFPEATKINSSAFSKTGFTAIAKTAFPSVTAIGDQAFSYCDNLTSVEFSNATTIGSSAFSTCPELATVNFPKVYQINTYGFAYCNKLANASFPMVRDIKGSAFEAKNEETAPLTIDFGSELRTRSGFQGVGVNVFAYRFSTFLSSKTNPNAKGITLTLGMPFVKAGNPNIVSGNYFSVDASATGGTTSANGVITSGDVENAYWYTNGRTKYYSSTSNVAAWGPFTKIIIKQYPPDSANGSGSGDDKDVIFKPGEW